MVESSLQWQNFGTRKALQKKQRQGGAMGVKQKKNQKKIKQTMSLGQGRRSMIPKAVNTSVHQFISKTKTRHRRRSPLPSVGGWRTSACPKIVKTETQATGGVGPGGGAEGGGGGVTHMALRHKGHLTST